nr:MAG TPA: hypothetical protein [Caudoviricetes sp.]
MENIQSNNDIISVAPIGVLFCPLALLKNE